MYITDAIYIKWTVLYIHVHVHIHTPTIVYNRCYMYIDWEIYPFLLNAFLKALMLTTFPTSFASDIFGVNPPSEELAMPLHATHNKSASKFMVLEDRRIRVLSLRDVCERGLTLWTNQSPPPPTSAVTTRFQYYRTTTAQYTTSPPTPLRVKPLPSEELAMPLHTTRGCDSVNPV